MGLLESILRSDKARRNRDGRGATTERSSMG
jgi:hypothetical protein